MTISKWSKVYPGFFLEIIYLFFKLFKFSDISWTAICSSPLKTCELNQMTFQVLLNLFICLFSLLHHKKLTLDTLSRIFLIFFSSLFVLVWTVFSRYLEKYTIFQVNCEYPLNYVLICEYVQSLGQLYAIVEYFLAQI